MIESSEVPSGAARARRYPEYELSHAPEGEWSSWDVRQNVTQILQRELEGPAHGEDEQLDAAPDSLYLVGRIAPASLLGTGSVGGADGTDSDADLVEAEEARLGRGVPVGAVEEVSAADDDGVEDSPIRKGLMIPASMGLRFQVPIDLASVVVHAEWGTYTTRSTEDVDAGGRPRQRYDRTQHAHSVTLDLAALVPGVTTDIVLEDSVVVRVDAMSDGPAGSRRIVELALCNDREAPRRIPTDMWMYQTQLFVEAGGADVFLPVTDALDDAGPDEDDELQRLRLQYRNRLQFAVGRTCSADWTVSDGARRATQVRTRWLPVVETPQTRALPVDGAVLDMVALSILPAEELVAGLRPIVAGYRCWLGEQEATAATLPPHLRDVAEDTITDARVVADRLDRGLAFLASDEEALRCFRFMNRVMADQRIQSQVAALRTADPESSLTAVRALVEERGPDAHSWRAFQLAFVLLQIEALCVPGLDRRSSEAACAELLFFPTGGGKTEAYLGLAAFTFAIRRRQGIVSSADGNLDGNDGVAVLMRYTLRLLTAQQFQRATALVCAAEAARQADPGTWGTTPFRIGLWVGAAVSPKHVKDAQEQLKRVTELNSTYGLTVLQLQRCPWCGTTIDGARNVEADEDSSRVRVYCGDRFAGCPFSKRDGGEGLPVLTVDEEIYRLTPAFVIATVDKFARLAREGEAAALFGYVGRVCERHGYVHPDYTGCGVATGGTHPRKGTLGRASVRGTGRLRPPDLIIQDELHLITGALGTTVGAFEMAIDVLCSWRQTDGTPVRPLVVASTATVRNARDQVKGLYGREIAMFPPQVLDVADTFFSKDVAITQQTPGRQYIGVSTTGVRLTAAEIVVASTLLSTGQLMIDRAGAAADPYLTLVAYFNATRELAGMARYMADDVQTAIERGRRGKSFPLRFGTVNALNVAELTSRVASTEIGANLDQMAVEFDPAFDSTAARDSRPPRRATPPFDVVLATSMLQVGVDVTRLGLMLMVGQPKSTAEYIQASSRVGRDYGRPGLVVTLGNWARPRDLAHFEQFRHYHETFYSQVEPLSVTPYSFTSLERSIDGVLVSAARVLDAPLDEESLSRERGAGRIAGATDRVQSLVDRLVDRARMAGGEDAAHEVSELLANRVQRWRDRARAVERDRQELVYSAVTTGSTRAALLRSAEDRQEDGLPNPVPFSIPNSMREVQPEINLLVTPLRDKLMSRETYDDPPAWPAQGNAQPDGATA